MYCLLKNYERQAGTEGAADSFFELKLTLTHVFIKKN